MNADLRIAQLFWRVLSILFNFLEDWKTYGKGYWALSTCLIFVSLQLLFETVFATIDTYRIMLEMRS